MKRRRTWFTLGLLLALIAARAGAARRPDDPDQARKLVPQPVAGLEHGAMAVVQGRASSGGDRYSVPDLDLMQPVAVRVQASEPAAPVTVEIVKGSWEKVFRACTTDATGLCEVRFRTEGSFGVRVSAARGSAAYELALWVGEEVRAVPANLLVPASRVGGAGAGLSVTTILLGVIAFALVGLLAVVAWMAFRSRPKGVS